MLLLALFETAQICHTYIADGWPGPCVTVWRENRFVDWFPCLTIERAEDLATRI